MRRTIGWSILAGFLYAGTGWSEYIVTVPVTGLWQGEYRCQIQNVTTEPRIVWASIVEASTMGSVEPEQRDTLPAGATRELRSHTRSARRCYVSWSGLLTDLMVTDGFWPHDGTIGPLPPLEVVHCVPDGAYRGPGTGCVTRIND